MGHMAQERRANPTIGMLTSFPPTPCGLATFSAGLADGLCNKGSDVGVIRVADGAQSSSTAVIGEFVNGSSASVDSCVELLNQRDVAVIQHDHDLFGTEVLDVVEALRVPTLVVAHEILKHPTPQQRSLMETMAAKADRIVVMSRAANDRLCADYAVDGGRVVTIQRGATLPTVAPLKRSGRPTLLTWGLMGPGKGVERVIDAMSGLKDLRGQPRQIGRASCRERV